MRPIDAGPQVAQSPYLSSLLAERQPRRGLDRGAVEASADGSTAPDERLSREIRGRPTLIPLVGAAPADQHERRRLHGMWVTAEPGSVATGGRRWKIVP